MHEKAFVGYLGRPFNPMYWNEEVGTANDSMIQLLGYDDDSWKGYYLTGDGSKKGRWQMHKNTDANQNDICLYMLDHEEKRELTSIRCFADPEGKIDLPNYNLSGSGAYDKLAETSSYEAQHLIAPGVMLEGVPEDGSGTRQKIVGLTLNWESSSYFSAILKIEILNPQGEVERQSLWSINKQTDSSNHQRSDSEWKVEESETNGLKVNDIGLDNHLVLTLTLADTKFESYYVKTHEFIPTHKAYLNLYASIQSEFLMGWVPAREEILINRKIKSIIMIGARKFEGTPPVAT
jgi:hypothetical protein